MPEASSPSTIRIISLALTAVALLIIFVIIILTSYQRVGTLTSPATAVQAITPSQVFETVDIEPSDPVEEPAEPAPAQVQAVAPQVSTDVETEPEVAPSPWTEAMTTAGILPTDQPIVLAMLFTRYEWDVHECACSRLVRGLTSAESRFTYLNQYVSRTYGSWVAAKAQAANGAW